MARTTRKRARYCRANWGKKKSEHIGLLQAYLDRAHLDLPFASDRVVEYRDRTIMCLHQRLDEERGATFLHLAAFSPEQHASIVSKASRKKRVKLKDYAPPEDGEYCLGCASVLIKSDSILYFADVRFPKTMLDCYLREMAEIGGNKGAASSYASFPVGVESAIQAIEIDGIESIELNAQLSAASLHRAKRKSGARNSFGELLRSLRNDARSKSDAQLGDVQVTLELRVSGGSKTSIGSQEEIDQEGRDILSDEADTIMDYVIVTKAGRRIAKGEVTESCWYRLEVFSDTVNVASAWRALETYYDDLKGRGAFKT